MKLYQISYDCACKNFYDFLTQFICIGKKNDLRRKGTPPRDIFLIIFPQIAKRNKSGQKGAGLLHALIKAEGKNVIYCITIKFISIFDYSSINSFY